VGAEAVINTLVMTLPPLLSASFARPAARNLAANIGFTPDSLQLTQTLANVGYIHARRPAGRALVFTAAERFPIWSGKSSSRKFPQHTAGNNLADRAG